jgi:hypothetical protein
VDNLYTNISGSSELYFTMEEMSNLDAELGALFLYFS